MNLSNKTENRKSSFTYSGVKVTFNEVTGHTNADYFRAVRAYQDFEHFDEASQVRLIRRYFKYIRALFFDDLKDRARGWCAISIKYTAPEARELLMFDRLDELALLPPYETPAERLAWNRRLDVAKFKVPTKKRVVTACEPTKSSPSRITFSQVSETN